LLNFLYLDNDYDFSKYNDLETTFTPSNPSDCWSFEWLLKSVNISYKYTTTYSSKSFIKFNLMFPTEYSDLYRLPEEIWSKIKDNNDIFLLLYQATEATPFYFWKYRWNKLKDFLLEKDIPPEKVYYICGDLDAANNHKKYNDDYWSKINVLGIDIFEIMHLFRHLKISGNNYDQIISEHQKAVKNKNFLNLNKRMRPNKQALIYYIHKHKLLDNNLVSNLWHESNILSKEDFDYWYNYDQSEYKLVKKVVPKKLLLPLDDPNNDQHSDKDLYLKTKYSLVSETYTGNKIKFITEKTYKPILMGHPFLIHGTSGTLEYLRSLGYETFPELFNENYDEQTDTKQQLHIVIENLKRDIDIDKHILEKCKHNQDLFLKQPTKNIIKDKLIKFLY